MKNVISNKSHLSALILIVLVAAMVLSLAACGSANEPADVSAPPSSVSGQANVIGEGAKSFSFEVVDAEGKSTVFTVNSDAQTVGEALLSTGLIEGDEGPYGLYVKTVNGITVDYDTDGKYWAFYVNGEYANSGIDLTDIEDGALYAMKVE